MSLAKEAIRLPYFFTHGPHGAVVCPSCAKDAPEPEKLTARYTANRAYRCGHCLIWIGPVNADEATDA